jgi:hypothetical protein
MIVPTSEMLLCLILQEALCEPLHTGTEISRLTSRSGFVFCRPFVGSLGHAPWSRYAQPMCGRVHLSSDVSEFKLVFSSRIDPARTLRRVGMLRLLTNCRSFASMRGPTSAARTWRGLVPLWAKDVKVGFTNTNAQAEGIEVMERSRTPLSI